MSYSPEYCFFSDTGMEELTAGRAERMLACRAFIARPAVREFRDVVFEDVGFEHNS